jgi:ABC-type glucose/galactose transport system permease subunit
LVGHGDLIGYVLKVIILDEVPFALCFRLFSPNVLFISKGLKVEIFWVDAFGMHRY